MRDAVYHADETTSQITLPKSFTHSRVHLSDVLHSKTVVKGVHILEGNAGLPG